MQQILVHCRPALIPHFCSNFHFGTFEKTLFLFPFLFSAFPEILSHGNLISGKSCLAQILYFLLKKIIVSPCFSHVLLKNVFLVSSRFPFKPISRLKFCLVSHFSPISRLEFCLVSHFSVDFLSCLVPFKKKLVSPTPSALYRVQFSE